MNPAIRAVNRLKHIYTRSRNLYDTDAFGYYVLEWTFEKSLVL